MSFFAYLGSWIFCEMTKFFYESYGPEIHWKLHQWCCKRILKLFRLFRATKKMLYQFLIFWVFLHIRGHGFFEKMTKFFFESYGPDIHRKLHKWCCGRILKLFRLFRGKKSFCINFAFLCFFAYPGSWIFCEITKFFYESYWPEIHRKLQKWCCGRILKLFRLFRGKKQFCINFSFFEFFYIWWVMDLLKNH